MSTLNDDDLRVDLRLTSESHTIPHEPPEVPERWRNTTQDDFLRYLLRFGSLGVWCAILVLNFVLSYLFMRWNHLPSDGESMEEVFDVYDRINHLLLYGVVLGWFVGATEFNRVKWLLHRRRWYFYLLFFGVPPIYSAITDAQSLQHSSEDTSQWGPTMWIVILLSGAIVVGLVLWHLHYAYRNLSFYGMVTYLLARVIVILYYGIFALLMKGTRHSDVHLHHFFVAWIVALFAEFSHPVSAVTLGVSSAIFVQGIAVYGFDPLFNERAIDPLVNDQSCHSFYAYRFATCFFHSTDLFSMRMCPSSSNDEVHMHCESIPLEKSFARTV